MAGWTSFFSRDPSKDFPYELQAKLFEDFNVNLWSIHSVKKRSTDEVYTQFSLDLKACPATQVTLAKAYVKRLKTLKHPNILSYVDSLETPTVLSLVTESVVPLSVYLAESKLTASQRESITLWGFFQLTNALNFLTNDAKLIHNNIHVNSVFVTRGGDWKVGGLEFVIAQDEMFSEYTIPSKPHSLSKYEPPENKSGISRRSKVWSTDIWGTACLLWEVFNGSLPAPNNLKTPKDIPKSLHTLYSELISAPEKRPSPEEILNISKKPGGIFKNSFVEAMLFISEIQIKDADQKNRFFAKLNDSLESFPNEIAKYKILPQLISAFEFGTAGSSILPPLFKLGKLLDSNDYEKLVVPCLIKLFASSDRAIRVKLLQQVPEFIEHFQPNSINEKVFPNIVSGFTDTNPAVREATVKAMIHIAPKLNYNNLNIELMKHFAFLQGKDDQSRQRILVSAFTRALRDPFPPARISGIMALSGTQQFYHLAEVANRLIPALSVLAIDPEKTVREQAFKAIRGFLAKLEKASENPELAPEMEAQVMAGSGLGILSSGNVPSWAEWALSSLSSKFYKGSASVAPSAGVAAVQGNVGTDVQKSVGQPGAAQQSHINQGTSKLSKTQSEVHADDDYENWGDIESSNTVTATQVSDNNAWEDSDEDVDWGSIDSLKKNGNSHLVNQPVESRPSKNMTSTSDTWQDRVTPDLPVESLPSEGNWNAWDADEDSNFAASSKSEATSRNLQRRQNLEDKRKQKAPTGGPMKLGAKKLNID